MEQTASPSHAILCVVLCVGTALGNAPEVADPTCAASVLQQSASTQLLSAQESAANGELLSLIDASVATANSGFSAAGSRLAEMVESMVESGRSGVVSSVWLEPSLRLLHVTGKLLRSDPDPFNVTDFNMSDFNITDFNDEVALKKGKVQYFMEMASYLVIPIIAYIYWSRSKKTQPEVGTEADLNDFDHWQHGICCNLKVEDMWFTQCSFATCQMCCLACFCPSVRWADTVRRVGFMGFWMAWGIFFVANRVIGWAGYLAISNLAAVALGTYFRQQMRQAYNMKEKGGCSWVYDCCLYCFCAPCAIVQEAKQADEAFRVGLPVAVQPRWKQVPFPANKGECCP